MEPFFTYEKCRRWDSGGSYDFYNCVITRDAGNFVSGEKYETITPHVTTECVMFHAVQRDNSPVPVEKSYLVFFAEKVVNPRDEVKWWSLWVGEDFQSNFKGSEVQLEAELAKRRPKRPEIYGKPGKATVTAICITAKI